LRTSLDAWVLCPEVVFGSDETAHPLVSADWQRSPRALLAATVSPLDPSDQRAHREQVREAFFMDETRDGGDGSDAADGGNRGAAYPSDVLGRVQASRVADLFARPIAATQAERYARCAFVGLASHVFRADDVAFDAMLMDPRQEGSLLHEVLASTFEHIREELAARPRKVDSIQSRALRYVRAKLSSGASSLKRVQYAEIEDTVLLLVEQAVADLEWDFDRAELAFGEGKALPAIRITGPQKSARSQGPAVAEGPPIAVLEGRIDRIDRSHDGKRLRIIDYKRRSVPEKRHLGTQELQVPLYVHLAANSTADTTDIASAELPKSVEGLYLAKLASTQVTQANAESAMETVRKALHTVASGDLRPRPIHPEICVHCTFDGFCRKPIFSVEEEEAR
jgi:CRISPR/Cas system-associated exonuclease Cas4 (RecB family)